MLEELNIPVKTPYSAGNLKGESPDLVIIANALSRGHEELEHVLASGLKYTSFPKLLGDEILSKKSTIVISGTHGKTTTTSIGAHIFNSLGLNPSFLIGGIPRNFQYSFKFQESEFFLIEGDEYDTAFFDKGPKFLHYHPTYLILNNLEFDHADIYENLDQIEQQFLKLCALVKNKKYIIANYDDPGIRNLIEKAGLCDEITKVSVSGSDDANLKMLDSKVSNNGNWEGTLSSKKLGSFPFQTTLSGAHNMANICQIVALIGLLIEEQTIDSKLWGEPLAKAIESFAGVKRRLDHLGKVDGIDLYEDFAHHPTAIKSVIEGFKKAAPERRLLVAFEPANATGRRNVFLDDFANSLSLADLVFIAPCPVDERIPADQRMDTKLMKSKIGPKAESFDTYEGLLSKVLETAQSGDAVVFMSPSSFKGIQYKLIAELKQNIR